MTQKEELKQRTDNAEQLIKQGTRVQDAVKEAKTSVGALYRQRRLAGAAKRSEKSLAITRGMLASPKFQARHKYKKHANGAVLLPVETPKPKSRVFVVCGSPEAVSSMIERFM